MQGLAAVRLMLRSGLDRSEDGTLREAAQTALAQVDGEIAELRGLIAEMRSGPD